MLRWQPVKKTVQLRSGTPQQDDFQVPERRRERQRKNKDDRQAKVERSQKEDGSLRRQLNGLMERKIYNNLLLKINKQ